MSPAADARGMSTQNPGGRGRPPSRKGGHNENCCFKIEKDAFSVLRSIAMRVVLELRRLACRAALVLVGAVVPVMGQSEPAGTVEARLDSDGRAMTLTAPGLAGFRGGFSATIVAGSATNVLSSESGSLVGVDSYTAETTPYGSASVSSSTIRFEREQIDLLFRLDQIPGVPVVMLQAGIRNTGDGPVNLVSVAPLEIDEGGPRRSLRVSGNPADWLITGLNARTSVLSSLRNIAKPLELYEQGGFYRRDGAGFLFGPVGTPVAYVSARVAALGGGRAGLSLRADMGGVRVDPGQARWGQQVALFLEPPSAAVARWAEWVAKTHGARTSKGALSGWCSWYYLKKDVAGKDVLKVANQVLESDGHLTPGVIQIDVGYESESGVPLETNPKFSEGLAYYAKRIAATGARPGLRLEFVKEGRSLDQDLATVKGAVQSGFSYLKITYKPPLPVPGGTKTPLEAIREIYQDLRKAAGDGTYILQNGYIQKADRAAVGAVDACRSGKDNFRTGVRNVMESVLRAYPLNGRWFAVDNDVFYMATELKDVSPVVGGWPLARTWISMVGLSCGAAITSDPWNEERFKPYWRNVEVLTPPAKERTEVLDLCTGLEWPRLVGHVSREWGNWTVALLWNPADKEQVVTLDFARIGLDPKRRYAAWSFWDNRYLGVVEGSYTTPFLAPSASQHLCFTELPEDSNKPVLVGSSLHIYCGAAELKRVTALHSGMQIELTDAGARDGDLFVYSQFRPVVKDVTGCVVEGIAAAGENVWKLSLKGRRHGAVQRVELGIPLPATRQAWFWAMCALLAASLMFGAWRYIVAVRLQRERALEQERLRIARDIHDEVGASLTKIGYLATKLPDTGVAAAVREVVQAMDEIVWAVNPRNDTLENMANYLVHFAEEFVRPAGIACDLDVPLSLPQRSLSADIRHHVFMVVKEALNNAVKHGSPGRIRLGLAVEGELLTVVVQDDGCGFTPAPAAAGADGLANMRQRLAAIGGQIQLDSAPGKGTTVTVKVTLSGKRKS